MSLSFEETLRKLERKLGYTVSLWHSERPDLKGYYYVDSPMVRLDYCDFSGSVGLDDGNFERSNLTESKFDYSNLQSINLSYSDLRLATFLKADLHGADLQRTRILRTVFEKANLGGVKFRGAEIQFANFRGAEFDENTDFTGASFDEFTDFRNCKGLELAKGLPQWIIDKWLPKSKSKDIVAQAFSESSPDDGGDEGGEDR
jgi:uncharacterized protein YjbI with pentapeptide repeats